MFKQREYLSRHLRPGWQTRLHKTLTMIVYQQYLKLELVHFNINQLGQARLPFSCLFMCWNHYVCKHILYSEKDKILNKNIKLLSFLSKIWYRALLENFRSSKTVSVSNDYFDVINKVVHIMWLQFLKSSRSKEN